ncbi:MAG: tetratricopeptide repeat protein [Candidatus Obscuribacterales bacterium]|nr:tetratricopeptide repeat protein [Candidatus Obscuribacterales bacterium]
MKRSIFPRRWHRIAGYLLAGYLLLPADSLAADELARAQSLLTSGRAKEAAEVFGRLINDSADKTAGYLGRGQARLILNDYDGALADFTKVIELNPERSGGYNNRALCYLGKKQKVLALADLNKAIEITPGSRVYRVNRAFLLSELAETDRALIDYIEALQLAPERAEQLSADALKRLPECQARLLSAGGWLALGNPDKAKEDASVVLKINPKQTSAYLIRAEAWKLLGNQKAARHDLSIASICGPQPSASQVALVPNEIVRREKTALDDIFKDPTVQTIKNLADARHAYALAILSVSDERKDRTALELAAAYALSAANLDTKNADQWFLAGLIYQELTRLDNRALPMAEGMFEQTVEVDPEHAAAWLELGLMMVVQDRHMEAMRALEKALEIDPAATAAYAVGPLCTVYATTDQVLRGRAFFEEQYEANPEVPGLGTGVALMLYCSGDRSMALSQVRDLILLKQPGTQDYRYLTRLASEWAKEKP